MTEIEKESVTVLKKLRDAYYKCEPDSEMKDVARLIVASALDVAIDALERDKWISVEERLPTAERKHYWICTDTGYQCECRWTNNLFGIGDSDNWGWSIFDIPQYQKVVAWRPLPDTYVPQKEETK